MFCRPSDALIRLVVACSFVTLISAVGANHSLGQVRDWASSSNGLWGESVNWNPMDVPDSVVETASFNVGGTYSVDVAQFHQIGGINWFDQGLSLRLENSIFGSGNLLIDSDATINGALHLTGNVVSAPVVFQSPNITNSATGTIFFDGPEATFPILRQISSTSFQNQGTIHVDQTGTITGDFTNTGTINVAAGKEFIAGGTIDQVNGTVHNLGTVRGISTFNFSGGSIAGNAITLGDGSTLNINTTNQGKFDLQGLTFLSGNVSATQQVAVFSGTTTDVMETFSNSGLIHLNDQTNSTAVTLRNSSGFLRTLTNEAGGTIRMSGGTAASIPFLSMSVSNHGLIDFDSPSQLAVIGESSGVVTNFGEIIARQDGSVLTLQGDSFLNQQGGVLSGAGEFRFQFVNPVMNDGIIAPGLSPGELTLDGDITFGNTSELLIELGGLAAGQEYDVLIITGDANLNGMLEISFLDGFEDQVTNGDTFTILNAGNLSGTFNNLPDGSLLATNGGHGTFQISYSSNNIVAEQLSKRNPRAVRVVTSFVCKFGFLLPSPPPLQLVKHEAQSDCERYDSVCLQNTISSRFEIGRTQIRKR